MLPEATSDRLVSSPVFILSSIRSGSTLLRCILDTHTRIRAPHELHLGDLQVQLASSHSRLAMETTELGPEEIQYLLWDRLLHRELALSGKDILVEKTPDNLLYWRRLAECWPDARFIFLLRHPLHILQSAIAARPGKDLDDSVYVVTMYLRELDRARRGLAGLTVRYEDLTSDPEAVTQSVCAHLDVPWEAGMLDYGKGDHGPLVAGIGDFTENIRSGAVQLSRSLPSDSEIPDYLREACEALGYAGRAR